MKSYIWICFICCSIFLPGRAQARSHPQIGFHSTGHTIPLSDIFHHPACLEDEVRRYRTKK